ncbi:MAG: hypothetical protein CL492_05860, partial [Acinetobacter sp.]|nr:hypothetical protein [Acinetobacter sp.]
SLVEAGCVYVAKPPLFRIDVGKQVYYAKDLNERDTSVVILTVIVLLLLVQMVQMLGDWLAKLR